MLFSLCHKNGIKAASFPLLHNHIEILQLSGAHQEILKYFCHSDHKADPIRDTNLYNKSATFYILAGNDLIF